MKSTSIAEYYYQLYHTIAAVIGVAIGIILTLFLAKPTLKPTTYTFISSTASVSNIDYHNTKLIPNNNVNIRPHSTSHQQQQISASNFTVATNQTNMV
jgi:hypothetical protein